MLRACLMMLVLYAALFAGYYYWIGPQFDPPWVYVGVGVVALIVSGCIGALINVRTHYRDWSLLSAARHNLPWIDGRWTAVCGEVHPVHEPLTAPFSGEECVLVEYDVARPRRPSSPNQQGTAGSDFAGFLMNPCVVRTGSGDVRLLGFPHLDGFAKRTCTGELATASAREYLRICKFEDYSGLKLVTVVGALTDAWLDDDGLVRKNLRLGKTQPSDIFPELKAGAPEAGSAVPVPQDSPPEDELDDEDAVDEDDLDDEELDDDDFDDATYAGEAPVLKEKRVKVGEKVCAIGIYSQSRGGLTPGGMGLDKFIKLVRGNIDTVEKKARGAVFGNLIGGIVGLILVNGATYGVLMANRHHPAAITERQRDAVQAVSKGDAARLDKLLSRGMDVNALESGRTLLHNTDDAACARVLLARGANIEARSDEGLTPLMEVARRGYLDVAKVLLEAKADVNAVNKEHPMTALDYAVRAGQADLEALLRQAGGKQAPPAEQP